MTQQEIVNAMALTSIKGITQATALQLYQAAGSATDVINLSDELQKQMPTKSWEKIKNTIVNGKAQALERAEVEYKFCQSKNIQMLTLNDDNYPYRLREISDAPLVLFYKGTSNLNAKRVVSIVGTRKITEYGKDICRTFLPELQRRLPDTLILSGLAYGVDVCAHRFCLEHHLPTIGILARIAISAPAIMPTTTWMIILTMSAATSFFSLKEKGKIFLSVSIFHTSSQK
jgi:DNA processing protein